MSKLAMQRVFKCKRGRNRKAAAVAADALWQLQTGRLMPRHCYLAADNGDVVTPEHLQQRKPVCEACAIGGLMVAYLRKFDVGWVGKSAVSAPEQQYQIRKKLSDVFSVELLTVIESIYEEHRLQSYHSSVERFAELANPLGDDYDWKQRPQVDLRVMSAIYRNIVANNGNFRPETGLHPEIGVKLVDGNVKVFRKRRKK